MPASATGRSNPVDRIAKKLLIQIKGSTWFDDYSIDQRAIVRIVKRVAAYYESFGLWNDDDPTQNTFSFADVKSTRLLLAQTRRFQANLHEALARPGIQEGLERMLEPEIELQQVIDHIEKLAVATSVLGHMVFGEAKASPGAPSKQVLHRLIVDLAKIIRDGLPEDPKPLAGERPRVTWDQHGRRAAEGVAEILRLVGIRTTEGNIANILSRHNNPKKTKRISVTRR